MNRIIGTTAVLMIVAFVAGWFLKPDSNAKATYGDTGLPKNCRAVVAENVEQWMLDEISAEGALNSIDRNCGRDGYSW